MASAFGRLGKRPLREPTPPSLPSSSSSSSPASLPPPSPPHHPDDDLHPWLLFTAVEDRRTFGYLRSKDQETSRCISWATLRTLQLEDRAREMLGPIWQRFFAISHRQYRLFILEFFSTFSFVTPCHDYCFHYSTLMGLYTLEELDSPIFHASLTTYPEGVTSPTYWPTIGTDDYDRRTSTRLRDPLHRIIHRLITYTMCGRRESSHVSTAPDLLILYFITSGTMANMAYLLADHIAQIPHARQTSRIYGGSYVTGLARSYRLIPVDEAPLNPSHTTTMLDMKVLRNMWVATH